MNITDMVRYDEGEKLSVYKDTEGYWTVGVGHLLTKDLSKEKAIKALDRLVGHQSYGYINPEESRSLLEKDINSTVNGLSKSKLSLTYTTIDSPRRAALVNMCFQLGVNGVCQFNKMIQHLNNKRYEEAADEALNSRWAKQTPNRAKRVTDVIRYGDYRSYI